MSDHSGRTELVYTSALERDGTLHSDSRAKADVPINQFKSVFTQEKGGPTPTLAGPHYPSISEGVRKLLSDLKTNKASWPDNISTCILKELANDASQCILYTVNKSGSLPSDWTMAHVLPIYKKGSHILPENYRPVSLTCILCKVMEHIICKHTDKHNILTLFWHWFRQARSCKTQQLTTLYDLLAYWNKNSQLDVIVLDFSKVFDTVSCDRLLGKCQYYGIDNNITKWIGNFLKTTSQRVIVDRTKSDQVDVDSGVPQITVLRPLFFLLHINDLPLNVKAHVRLFADDCLIYRPIRSQRDQIAVQEDLDTLAYGAHVQSGGCASIPIKQTSEPDLQNLDHQRHYLVVTITQGLFHPHLQVAC